MDICHKKNFLIILISLHMNLYCFHWDLCEINLLWYLSTFDICKNKFICQKGQMSSGSSGPMFCLCFVNCDQSSCAPIICTWNTWPIWLMFLNGSHFSFSYTYLSCLYGQSQNLHILHRCALALGLNTKNN